VSAGASPSTRGEAHGGLRIGPAGWSYDDWRGIVYPAQQHGAGHELDRIVRYFDTVEINSSYYHPVRPEIARVWARKAQANPRFRFTAKLYRRFTHERDASATEEREVKNGFAPLLGSGKLGALLLQFPWSFKNTLENRQYLAGLFMRFQEYPLVTEVRHASWNQASGLSFFADHGVGFCNIDQPIFDFKRSGRSLGPSADVTSPLGYVRLHGRNYESWFAHTGGVEMRYDYLYSDDELNEWSQRIKKVASSSVESYAILNNHYQGKAVVNALQMRAKLEGQRIAVPDSLAAFYPQLNEIAVREETLAFDAAAPFVLV
jgi:uncharacterized protein YecE (DUF72 family)